MIGKRILFGIALILMLGILPNVLAQCPVVGHPGSWSAKTLPVANSEFAAAALNNRIYLAGGYLSANHSLFLIHDPAKNLWTRGPDIPVGTHHAALVAFQGRLYLIGGEHAESLVQIFDPLSGAWSRGRNMPTPRVAMAGVVVNGRLHLIGGTDNIRKGNAMVTHEAYDPAADAWTKLAPLPVGAEHTFGTFLNGRIFVIGGRSGFVNLPHNQVYDPATNSWSAGAPLQHARSGMGLALFEKRIYVFGGEDLIGRVVLSSVERYDPSTKRWEFLTPLPRPVHGNPAAALGRFVYIFGGSERAASGLGIDAIQRFDISNAPLPPRSLTAQRLSSASVRLHWTDASANETQFLVQAKKSKGPFKTVSRTGANANETVLKDLKPAAPYSFRIVAQNGCGLSSPSNTIAVPAGNAL